MATFERCEHTRTSKLGKLVEIKASIVRLSATRRSEEEKKARRYASWKRWYENNKEAVAEASYKRYHEKREKILQQREAEPPKEPKQKKGYMKTNKIFKKEAAALAAALKDIKLVTLDFLLSNISLQV